MAEAGGTSSRDSPLISVSLYRSLPLFISSAVLFVIGLFVLYSRPHFGPGFFSLWALFVALGFVAAIGGVASWLLVEEPSAPSARGARTRPAKEDAPGEPDRVPLSQPSRVDRADFGRPSPLVHDRGDARPYAPTVAELGTSVPPAPEWDEDAPTVTEPLARSNWAESFTPADALRDLDGIEQELVPRSSARSSPPTTA